jgi:hypothetical protein
VRGPSLRLEHGKLGEEAIQGGGHGWRQLASISARSLVEPTVFRRWRTEPACASESHHDASDDEGAAVDIDPVLVAVTVAISLEIEPVEGVPARHLDAHMPQIEP